MPSRGMILVILLGWLGTTGWLFWQDLWPRWQPGQPPSFDIDLVDEVQRDHPPTFWDVRCLNADEEPGQGDPRLEQYQALTQGEYHPWSAQFILHCELQVRPGLSEADRPGGLVRPNPIGENGINNYIVSTCSVTRAGQLRDYRVQMTGRIARGAQTQSQVDRDFAALFLPGLTRPSEPFTVDLSGEVRQDQLYGHVRMASGKTELQGDLPPQPVGHFGAVLMPLHPLHRIAGLHPGRRWSVPLVHPLQAALQAVKVQGEQPEQVQAEVRPALEDLKDWDKKDRSCLIVDYRGKDVSGLIWVDQDSGRVLRQVMTLWNQKWIFDRRPSASVRRGLSI